MVIDTVVRTSGGGQGGVQMLNTCCEMLTIVGLKPDVRVCGKGLGSLCGGKERSMLLTQVAQLHVRHMFDLSDGWVTSVVQT